MIQWDKLTQALIHHGFAVSRFATGKEAADYLDGKLDGRTIGMGGSVTLQELGLYDRLAAHNTVHWHWSPEGPDARAASRTAQVYLTSANALAETGEIFNIDGHGNRVAATLDGHEEVYFVVGANKIAPDADAALFRARNVAGPKNAQRLGRKTPCAAKGDRCYDCNSPERVCGVLVTLWRRPVGIPYAEVVLVGEELGY
ncbi:MAG: lactate utilization protein [Pseudoflavonifractor sp.]|nr:lactate utilization protein [Pseudoflavonifractor sp.]